MRRCRRGASSPVRRACRARSRQANTWNARSASASPAICRRDSDEYSEQEVFDALEACAAFELVDSRFRDLKSAMEQHALRILRRPHRQRRHGVRTLPQGLADIRFHQDPRVDEAGRQRPSSKRPAAIRPAIRPGPPWCWPTSGAARRGSRPARSSSPARSPAFTRSSSNQPVTGEFEGFGTMEATICRS